MTGSPLAFLALVALALGSVPQAAAGMTATLCSGVGSRTVEIPIPGKEPQLPMPCPAKACHAGCPRKRFDPAQ